MKVLLAIIPDRKLPNNKRIEEEEEQEEDKEEEVITQGAVR
jgi:hypothetical protein